MAKTRTAFFCQKCGYNSPKWMGKCPFHEEATGSFAIFPDNRGKCFGCGWSGDVITFVMDSQGLTFPEAVRKLL
jgi:DNA primase